MTKKLTIEKVLKEINERIEHHPLKDLQKIRMKALGNQRRGSKTVFRKPKPGKHYIFHSGGRTELQFNIAINEKDETVRFGVAYSISKDQTLTNIDNLRPSIELFNKYIKKNPKIFSDMIMSHTGSKDYKPKIIPNSLIKDKTFVFIGVRIPFDTLDYDKAAKILNSLFPLYLYTISANLKPKKIKTVKSLIILDEDDESTFPEGKEKYKMHKVRERDPGISRRAKEKRKSEGSLSCEVCDFDFEKVYGELGDGYIEAHHTIPISLLKGSVKTKISDIALVCANCHRMLHRGPLLMTIKELRSLYKNG